MKGFEESVAVDVDVDRGRFIVIFVGFCLLSCGNSKELLCDV